jgi:hypothetical protein
MKNANSTVEREEAITRDLSPLIAKLYELDPVRASADTDAIIKTLQAAG